MLAMLPWVVITEREWVGGLNWDLSSLLVCQARDWGISDWLKSSTDELKRSVDWQKPVESTMRSAIFHDCHSCQIAVSQCRWYSSLTPWAFFPGQHSNLLAPLFYKTRVISDWYFIILFILFFPVLLSFPLLSPKPLRIFLTQLLRAHQLLELPPWQQQCFRQVSHPLWEHFRRSRLVSPPLEHQLQHCLEQLVRLP